jgi:hypothetical protein
MSRKKPRSPGVILRGRSLGADRYDDEPERHNGQKAHGRARARSKEALRGEIREDTGEEA